MSISAPLRQGHRVAALGGGAIFATSLLYFGFVYVRRWGAVADAPADGAMAILTNIVLFSAFALHHSVLARSGIKTRLARVIPPAIERTVYIWIASLLFIVVCAAWRPVPGIAWEVTGIWAWWLLGAQVGGAVIGLAAGRRVDVFELAGVREALNRPAQQASRPTERGPYGIVRHPLYLGFLLVVWPMPVMTGTRFVFALVSTVYVLVAIPFEERDLRKAFGDGYAAYVKRVRWRVLPGVY